MSQPGYFGCDTNALRERIDQTIADMFWSADVVFEIGLAESWDMQGWRCENNTKGRIRAHEDVLKRCQQK